MYLKSARLITHSAKNQIGGPEDLYTIRRGGRRVGISGLLIRSRMLTWRVRDGNSVSDKCQSHMAPTAVYRMPWGFAVSSTKESLTVVKGKETEGTDEGENISAQRHCLSRYAPLLVPTYSEVI